MEKAAEVKEGICGEKKSHFQVKPGEMKSCFINLKNEISFNSGTVL